MIDGESPLDVIDRADHLATSTKTQYHRALSKYLATGAGFMDSEALANYAHDLPVSGCAFLKAAVKLVTERMAAALKDQVNPEDVKSTQVALYRLEALQSAIETKTPQGTKAHTWLTPAEVRQLFATCEDDLKGQRDRVVLALLCGAGLRRAEAVNLTFADIVLQPRGDKMRTVLQVCGKGDKHRIVPISDSMANLLDRWAKIAGDGHVLRSITQRGEIGASMSSTAVFNVVREHGAAIGKMDLSPHDLRRSYAQIGLDSGISLVQISTLLGHSSVQTTQKYLNLALDLECTISDFVPVGEC